MNVLQRQWFLIALAVVLLLGFLYPETLRFVTTSTLVRDLIVASVLFAMTLPLDTKSIGSTLRRPGPAALAVGINFGLLPLAAVFVSRLFMQGDWANGLMVAAAAPCTLASAAVWTRKAGGNDVVALMVTVITNAACFIVTPLWLTQIAGHEGVNIEPGPMIVKLAVLVFLPMLLGQLLRMNQSIAIWSTEHKLLLGTLCQLGILSIVLIGAVHCGLHLRNAQTDSSDFAYQIVRMLSAVIVLHTSMLWLGQWLGRWLGLARADWIAVGFAGSQKTLMVGLQVALMVGGGLTILPMVAYHVCQLIIDTVVADRLQSRAAEEGP